MRLTNEKRDAIVNQIVSKMFSEREKVHAEKGKKLAKDALSLAFNHNLVQACPDGFLPETKVVNIYFPGSHSFHVCMDESFRFPYSLTRYGNAEITIPLDKLSKTFEKQISDHIYTGKKLATERIESKREVQSILYSVNTTKQLKEIWPDLFDLIIIDEEQAKPINQLAPLVGKYTKQLKSI